MFKEASRTSPDPLPEIAHDLRAVLVVEVTPTDRATVLMRHALSFPWDS